MEVSAVPFKFLFHLANEDLQEDVIHKGCNFVPHLHYSDSISWCLEAGGFMFSSCTILCALPEQFSVQNMKMQKTIDQTLAINTINLLILCVLCH